MKLFRLLIILILGGLLGCGSAPVLLQIPKITITIPLPSPPIVKTPIREMDALHKGLQDNTVALVSLEDDKIKNEKFVVPYCTAVWIGTDEILTAAHCVRDDKFPMKNPVGESIYYVTRAEIDPDDYVTYHPGTVIAYNVIFDLALIQVVVEKMPAHTFALLPNELPAVGETVYGVGHPSKLYWSFITGEISAYRHRDDLGNVIQINISVWFGDSGGGIFDHDGKLFGICSQKIDMSSMGYYVHLDNIKVFLKEGRLKRLVKIGKCIIGHEKVLYISKIDSMRS